MKLNLSKSTWTRHRFDEIAVNVKDRVDDPASSGHDRYVGLEHLDPGSMTISRWGDPSEVGATKLVFQAGDVIFARRRAYQRKVSQATFEGIASAHALVLRAQANVITERFLPVFLSSGYFLDRAISISVGSLSPTVNWRDLASQEFDLPPLERQEEIADLLWAVQNHMVALDHAASATRIAAGVLLTRPAAPDVITAPLADQFLHVIGGAWGDEPGASETPVLALGTKSYRGRLNVDLATATPRSLSAKRAERRVLQRGDIVLERSGGAPTQPVGRVIRMADDLDVKVVPSDFQRLLRPNPSLIDPEYVFWRMWGNYESGAVRSYQRATTNIRNLDIPAYLSETMIPIPSRSDQATFVENARRTFATINTLDGQTQAADRMRQVLISNVFKAGPQSSSADQELQ